MTNPFELTDAERGFLSHWMSEVTGPFLGPAVIWCWNNRINRNLGPYPLADLFSKEEVEAGRRSVPQECPGPCPELGGLTNHADPRDP